MAQARKVPRTRSVYYDDVYNQDPYIVQGVFRK